MQFITEVKSCFLEDLLKEKGVILNSGSGGRPVPYRQRWDHYNYAFPVIVRYIGLLTTLILIGFCLAGHYVEAAPGFVAAGGMLLYKTVNDAAKSSNDEEVTHDYRSA
jgi:hypothetical protein